MAKEAPKGKVWKVVILGALIYLVIYVTMSLAKYGLERLGQPGQMVGFTENLPIMMANLGILIWILNKLLYKPVLKFMEERNNRIARQIEEAEADRGKAREYLSQTEQELARIRKESTAMLREARQSAQTERASLIQQAERDRAGILDKANREIILQLDKAKSELQTEIADMAVQVARQVVSASLSEAELNRLAEECLVQMEQEKPL